MGEDVLEYGEEARRTAAAVAGSGGLEGLRRLTEAIAVLETQRTAIIDELRRQHRASWEQIGRTCGMTRQGATRRWSRQVQARAFGAAVAAYDRGRPEYPPSLVDWLVPRSAKRVLDLGAGTGKLTQLLVDAGLKVTAVEPSEQMREHLSAAVPAAAVRPGRAEQIPLADGSVDAVVVAQAWHWFELELAEPEVARVLVPGGTLSLVWNIRDGAEPWVADLGRILHQLTPQSIDTEPVVGEPFGPPERLEVRWTQTMTRAEVLDLAASRSYVVTLPAREQAQLLDEVSQLLGSHPDLKERTEIVMPYITRCTRVRRG
jgi:SAM-dependent methyltransferase